MLPLLNLDLAQRAGWAVVQSDKSIVSGTHAFPSVGDRLGRLAVAVDDWLRGMIDRHGIKSVAYESPTMSPRDKLAKVRKLYGYGWQVEFVCQQLGIPCCEAGVGEIRKHFIGRGNLPSKQAKAAVIAHCQMEGWTPADDNEADALALASYMLHQFRLAELLPAGAGPLFRKETS